MGIDDLPRIHPREQPVRAAERELDEFLHSLREKHELTMAEHYKVAVTVFDRFLSGLARTWIRQERHPDDPDSPGGLV